MNQKILIGVPTAEMARRADFYDYFNILDKPEGTVITFCHGQSPARNRNLIIEQALNIRATHVLFLDDDVAFKPSLLNDLSRHDVDAVTGLYFMRNFPHRPILFDIAQADGKCMHTVLNGQTGLIPAVASGLGCVLIKTDVFRAMDKPWITLGEAEKDHWCDDISFFNRFRAAGFQLWCDMSVLVGHMAQCTIWPEVQDNQWYVKYNTLGTAEVIFPIPRQEVKNG